MSSSSITQQLETEPIYGLLKQVFRLSESIESFIIGIRNLSASLLEGFLSERAKHVLVTSVRWENDSIVEWLNYHRFIGFDHVFIYCNDDDPTELYELLLPFIFGPHPYVTFKFFSIQGLQEHVFTHFLKHHVTECDWFCFLDADEYLLMRDFSSIEDLLASFDEEYDALYLSPVSAGHNDHVKRVVGSVIENYPLRSARVEGFTKCVARSKSFDEHALRRSFGGGWWHNIEGILYPGARIINVLGQNMSGYYSDLNENWVRISTSSYHDSIIAKAFVYHVGIKSEQDFLRRFNRGIGGVYDGQVHWKHLHEKGREAIQAHLAPMNAIREERLLEIRALMLKGAFANEIIPPKPFGRNLALSGIACQSSTSEHSKVQDVHLDAAGVIDGCPSGWHHHCTAFEDRPWWSVDLGQVYDIEQVRVFNRTDGSRDRFRNFTLCGSLDGSTWIDLYIKCDDQPFGGADGQMFIWEAPIDTRLRHCRVQALETCLLDLDQVEIYERQAVF